ncbi:MAG TPA: proprotein convertase P-domain-containing protein [Candidatus Krumholzibacteria bacterium]|nr:proprotein convertase P-domain-containing protein [Candidatus Krumholzibacteria bacterium]HPD70577.1 proprotein convertase P-domain-containing protein [Candidatus Krumholzibacteria bacterium]HRY39723.1 proprotein convertase P-domain-containing protein [Candidatus Krumholzibacteria bacterium]
MKTLIALSFLVAGLAIAGGPATAGTDGFRVITSATYTSIVGQVIPDGPAGGGSGPALLDTINVPIRSVVEGIEVYLDITMANWTSDLIVRLTSPAGTTLGIAWIGEGGIPETDIIGWFPVDFTPHDDLDLYVGEYTEGDWVLDCRDYSNGFVGTLNQWRLKVHYDDSVPAAAASFSRIMTLFR